MNLKHLTDRVLLADTKVLVANEREISLKVLHHLKEIEKRKLYSDLGYKSLFDYAVRDLGYSEPSAMRRIHASRLLKDLPEIEKRIESGKLSLTNLSLAFQLFKNEDIQDKSAKKEILEKIENTTKKECEKTLLDFSTPKDLPKEKEKQLTPTVTGINFNLSSHSMEKLRELRDLLAHKRWKQDEIVGFAFQAAIEKIQNDNAKFTTPAEKPCGTRYISKSLQRYVRIRDKKCVKCGSTHNLEFDHIKPFALGGETSRDNLRLLCRNCNQRARIRAKL